MRMTISISEKIIGNIINRDLTKKALELLNNYLLLKSGTSKYSINFSRKLGSLLNKHQEQLKEKIEITTPKIDEMITKCLQAGALGAKINGSGFGGMMFAISQGNEEMIKKSIEEAGGKAYLIKTSNGVENY